MPSDLANAEDRKVDHSNPLERYFTLLEIIAASPSGMNQTTLAKLSGFPKPAVHRLLSSLLNAGLVSADSETGKIYVLGARMRQLALLSISDDIISSAANLVLEPLARKFNETSFMVRLEGDVIRSIAMSAPERGYRLHILPGYVISPHAGASAKAVLAYNSDEILRRVVKEPLPALTGRTHTTLEALVEELKQIRSQGYAHCDGELEENAAAYACPVRMPDDEVHFSIGITGPRDRLHKTTASKYVDALKKAADQFKEFLSAAVKKQ